MINRFRELTKRAANCELCKLEGSQPNVLYTVHELHRRGHDLPEVIRRVKPVFAEVRREVPEPAVFADHIELHCRWDVEDGEADFETDYKELRSLYLDFRMIFSDVRTHFTKLQTEGEEATVSVTELQMLIKLASELRHMLKALTDMRNQDKLVGLILARHTEALVERIAEPIGTTFRSVRDRLESGDDPDAVVAQIDKLLDGEIYPIFEAAAAQAIERSRQQYNLH